jgi:signal transduction histidine kinase
MASSYAGSRLAALRALLPRGGALPETAWLSRHRGICALLWFHVVALTLIAVLRAQVTPGLVVGLVSVAALTLAASWGGFSFSMRSSLATLGLLSCSAILIGLYDGLIEAHFHFFVTIAVVSLYQAWLPYLIGVGYVLVHHLVLGTLLPDQVYNHHMAIEHPWVFALVHGGAILAESVACLVFWRVNEDALDAERANREALEQANDELSEANQSVADLVGMLSHDLRVPLTILIGYSEIALETWPELTVEGQLDFVRKVGTMGEALNVLLEDTLTVSALDAEGVVPRPVPLRVDTAIREALDSLPEPVPVVDLQRLEPATALMDRGHLGQVLHNLLSNALKYGGGSFAVSCREAGTSVLVEVTDHGSGVPAEFVPHLFDRFTRSEEARVGSARGTGLGLYITRSLLSANGAQVHYEPTAGGGATFCLRLVRAEPPVTAPALTGSSHQLR